MVGSVLDPEAIRKTANLLFLLFQAEKAGKSGKSREITV